MLLNGDESPHLDHFPFLAHLDILPEWEEAARRFLVRGGTAMVLGAPDTGKSTFSRYLVYRAFVAGEPAASVDLDLGQSHLGPPATLGLGLFPPRRPGDDGLFPEALYFIGQTSPVGAILEVVVGCRVLADRAAARGYTRVVVNTSGFVQGFGALRLKRAQMELLQPNFIFGLQRDQELEALLRGLVGTHSGQGKTCPCMMPEKSLAGANLFQLPVSPRARYRTAEERRAYREERFRRYFHRARRLELSWRSLMGEGVPWGPGEPLGENAAPYLPWTDLHLRLVGLLDAGRRTLAMGLILPGAWDPETLALWTPLAPEAANLVRFLKVGRLRLSLKGQELSHV